MMRIETDQTDDQLTLRVAGRLCGSCVEALEECWKTACLRYPAVKQSVDLSDVTSIDRTGWCLLRRMHHDGVEISGEGLAAQTIFDELTDKDLAVGKHDR
jgi:ABC-type transporter Mla MlaB component